MPEVTISDAYAHLPAAARVTFDALSFSVILGTLLNHLPTIAAGLSVIWSIIRIYETKSVQRLLARFGRKRKSPDNNA